MPEQQNAAKSDTLQKLGVPIAIVIAGALIAGAVYFSNGSAPAGGGQRQPGQVLEKIDGVRNDDHIIGSREAKVVIVEYSDTECPFCKMFHETLHQIVSEYEPNEVAWVFRHWPIPQLHPKAMKEAEALECAAEQCSKRQIPTTLST
jgi:protein-disulfide isomerase